MSTTLNYLLQQTPSLVWWVSDADRSKVNDLATFEAVLNYGTWQDVQSVIATLGWQEAYNKFKSLATAPRSNLKPEIKHFFSLYFAKHATTP